MIERIKNEPVLVMAVIQAGIAAAVAFGLSLTADQTAGVLGLAAAVLSLVTRKMVKPVK